jgi:hypothetical protein
VSWGWLQLSIKKHKTWKSSAKVIKIRDLSVAVEKKLVSLPNIVEETRN